MDRIVVPLVRAEGECDLDLAFIKRSKFQVGSCPGWV